MGFNSTRRYRDGKAVDIAILASGILVILVLLAWGFGLF
jgi:hypothetical protein